MIKINRDRTQIEVFTDDLNEAIEIAEAELGENIAEIEDYPSFFEGEEKKDRFVFVTPEHKLFPESASKEGTMEDRLDFGVYYTETPTTYHAQEDGSEPGTYILTHHEDEMPAHHEEVFHDVQALLNRMREIAPLREWKDCDCD